MPEVDRRLIYRASLDAQSRRPYIADEALIKAVIPPGGDWTVVAEPGAVCRSVMWGRTEVALVNPGGDLDDQTEGQIAMALRSLPLIDSALRCILVLAEDPANLALIRDIAVSAVAFIEMPAPAIHEPEDGNV